MAQRPQRRRKRKEPLLQRVRSNFLTGLVVAGPLLLTLYLIWLIVTFVDSRVLPWVPEALKPEWVQTLGIPGFGVLIFLVGTTALGYMTKGLFGRQIFRYFEGLVDRTPVVRSIYNAVKQIIETIFSQNQASFQNACLIQYPREGIWAVAFVSTEAKGELPTAIGHEDVLSVFLPTTPNPTSGFLLFLPRRDIVMLDMSVEDAAKLVISAGLVVPPTEEEIRAGRKTTARTAA